MVNHAGLWSPRRWFESARDYLFPLDVQRSPIVQTPSYILSNVISATSSTSAKSVDLSVKPDFEKRAYLFQVLRRFIFVPSFEIVFKNKHLIGLSTINLPLHIQQKKKRRAGRESDPAGIDAGTHSVRIVKATDYALLFN